MARRFLYIIAGLIVLTLAAAIGWNLFQDQILRAAFVPGTLYRDPGGAPDYARADAWVSRPDLADDPARWTPAGFRAAARPSVAVFFVPPTTYMRRDRWNAPLDDHEANERLRLLIASQASVFNGIGAIWAPRYRQATLGAFITERPDAQQAMDLAYSDVARAFDVFLAHIPAGQPILLAGHSQGSMHLLRLLHERIAGQPLAQRIAAAYVVGWPVSITADLPAVGLPACSAPGEPGCLLSWQSFAEPRDSHLVTNAYDSGTGLTGRRRRGTPMLCINPLTGAPGTAALASANLGALVPNERLEGATISRGLVPARCDASGFLMVGAPPPGYERYVMPGNNYHVFDYAMFWANIRADAEARVRAFVAAR